MNISKHNQINLCDYTPPEFLVDYINLTFTLGEKETTVRSRAAYRKNPILDNVDDSLFLDGEDIELVDIFIDGDRPIVDRLDIKPNGLSIKNVPDAFTLEITTRFNPEDNTALSGLYLSSGNFCTQCEAEGFRRITYYPDRPDVLARFKTRIEAHSTKFPVLLSNGNLIEKGVLEHGYHYATWEDPYPKPCYLFALVAGNLVSISDSFITKSGRSVALEIYVQQRNSKKCLHAMESLKKSMKWDEEKFGLEYDLDRYMIVAVDDFNMGAMENKGLNVFNSKYVLASPETATDNDYLGIEGVIAHEYFHNWTGNRVTCRDWFQLSLKEGLTVFRDQEFSSDMNSRAVQRIDDVRTLRQFQFREDASPMAHPVRPESYIEINNFYTVTVYNKGAEVVRMIHTIIGPENFRKGLDLYFLRHDGQAVTCEDFVAAMSDASSVDLSTFKLWYSQAGTPKLKIDESWHESEGRYSLHIRQDIADTADQSEKKPFHIPVLTGLLDKEGNDLIDRVECDYEKRGKSVLLELKEKEQVFNFSNLLEKPCPSLLREFSAPVKLESFLSRRELTFLMAHDSDLFNRWDAAFSLGESIIIENALQIKEKISPVLDETFLAAVKKILNDTTIDTSLAALTLTLPTESYLVQAMDPIDPDSLHKAYTFVKQTLAATLERQFFETYNRNSSGIVYLVTPEEIGKRSLKNICLSYLMSDNLLNDSRKSLCRNHYLNASNMTDTIAALSVVSHLKIEERDELLDDFERKWIEEPLVMDKWFMIQASSTADDTFERVQKLMKHPAFSLKNPNRVRSLIGAFSANHSIFHSVNGKGYKFLTDMILEIDAKNPQIAARLVNPLISWRKYEPVRRDLMRAQLGRILSKKTSRDVTEIVQKSVQI